MYRKWMNIVCVQHRKPRRGQCTRRPSVPNCAAESLHNFLEEIWRGKSLLTGRQPLLHRLESCALFKKMQRNGCTGVKGKAHLRPRSINSLIVTFGKPGRLSRTFSAVTLFLHSSVSFLASETTGPICAQACPRTVIICVRPCRAFSTKSHRLGFASPIERVFIITNSQTI